MNGHPVGGQRRVRPPPNRLVRFWNRYGATIRHICLVTVNVLLLSSAMTLLDYLRGEYDPPEFSDLEKPTTSLSTRTTTTTTQKTSMFSPRHENYVAPVSTCKISPEDKWPGRGLLMSDTAPANWLQEEISTMVNKVVDAVAKDTKGTSDQAPEDDTGDRNVQADTPSRGIHALFKKPPSHIRRVIICGHERHSCQAYGKPVLLRPLHLASASLNLEQEICCPPGYICHASTSTNSGILCCKNSASCFTSTFDPPTCPLNLVQCPRSVGGGCCPKGISCSAAGCIEFDGDGRSPAQPASRVATKVRNTGIAGEAMEKACKILGNMLAEDPRPTMTVAKYGEIRTMEKAQATLLDTMWRPFSNPIMIVAVLLFLVAVFVIVNL